MLRTPCSESQFGTIQHESWSAFVAAERAEELDRIGTEEGVDPGATSSFVDAAYRDGVVQPAGTATSKVLPPVSKFGQAGLPRRQEAVRARQARCLRQLLRPQLMGHEWP
jgi:hypothetical protein